MKQSTKIKAKNIERNTTNEQVELYSTIDPLLSSAFTEIKELSKKKQDEELNIKKVKMVNRLLEKAKQVLCNELTVEYLELLDEDDLPTNSDAVLTMSQYIAAFNKFRRDHYHLDGWDIEVGGDWD